LNFKLRPVTDADEEFLYRLYEATYGQQFALLPLAPAQRDALVRMQFEAQHSGYRQQCPASDDYIIVMEGEPSGRLWQDDSQPGGLRVLDVAILPEYQRRGLGAAVLRQTVEHARRAGKAVRLSVARDNLHALDLYQRLGFRINHADEVYLQLELPAAG
jgi:ribosomal protein S18 acetylase RimI-like enzyme